MNGKLLRGCFQAKTPMTLPEYGYSNVRFAARSDPIDMTSGLRNETKNHYYDRSSA
ncbi:MAG: hypothetical protein ACRD8Z_16050 [Nitrososphaeraceae archaeon]